MFVFLVVLDHYPVEISDPIRMLSIHVLEQSVHDIDHRIQLVHLLVQHKMQIHIEHKLFYHHNQQVIYLNHHVLFYLRTILYTDLEDHVMH